MKKLGFILVLSFIASSFFACHQQEQAHYKLVKTISIPGDSWWDYLTMDENTGRLFVSHGVQTEVVDSKTGKLIHTIPNTPGVHGITIDAKDQKAFISCGKDSSVLVVSLSTLEVLKKIKVTGANPDAILYDAFSGRVFVYNGRSANATVIDAKADTVVATIPLPGKPEFSVTNGAGKIYVNIEDKSLVVVLDANKLEIENIWSLSPGQEPSGLAIDNKNHRLFSVCDNQLMIVLDAQDGKVLDSLPIGKFVDGCAFDAGLNRAYSSNGDGTLTVVQELNAKRFSVLENVPTKKGARTIYLDAKTHHLYLPTAEFGKRPKATAENPHPRRPLIKGSFQVLEYVPVNQ
jgi:DNA-binding beta-propeller fold protein YncE